MDNEKIEWVDSISYMKGSYDTIDAIENSIIASKLQTVTRTQLIRFLEIQKQNAESRLNEEIQSFLK